MGQDSNRARGHRAARAAVTAAAAGDYQAATAMMRDLITGGDPRGDLIALGAAQRFTLELVEALIRILEDECDIDITARLATLYLEIESDELDEPT